MLRQLVSQGTACVSAGACGENVEPMQQAVPEPQDSDASVGELLSRSQFEQRRDNNSHMVELFTTCNSNTLTNENEASHMVPDSVGALEEAPNAVDCSDANTQVDEVTHHVSESNSRGSEAQQAPEMTVEMDPAAEYEASLPPTSAMATQTQQCPVLCIENIDSKPQGQQEDSHARDLSEDVPRSMSQGSKSGMASMREMCPVEGQQSNLVDQGAECVTPGEVPSQRTKDPEPRTSAETGALCKFERAFALVPSQFSIRIPPHGKFRVYVTHRMRGDLPLLAFYCPGFKKEAPQWLLHISRVLLYVDFQVMWCHGVIMSHAADIKV